MKTETTYQETELDRGKCTCCGEVNDTIVIDDGRCVDCIEEEKFFDTTMGGGIGHFNYDDYDSN